MNGILKASSLLIATGAMVQVAASASLADQPREPKAQVAVDRLAAAQPKASADAPPPVAGAGRTNPPAVPLFKITPHREAAGGDRKIQALAAELIGRQAEKDRSVPEGRTRHFSWIKLPILGWTGEVLDLAVVPTGLRARVRVYPYLGGCCALSQFAAETYLIKDGVARLTAIEYSDPKGPRILTFN